MVVKVLGLVLMVDGSRGGKVQEAMTTTCPICPVVLFVPLGSP